MKKKSSKINVLHIILVIIVIAICYFLYKFLKKTEGIWLPPMDFPHTDTNPNTLEYVKDSTIQSCFQKCQSNPRCQGIVTNFLEYPNSRDKTGDCWLKSNLNNPSFSTKLTSFKKINQDLWVPPMDYPHTETNPNTLEYMQNTSLEKCLVKCQQNSQCYGVVSTFEQYPRSQDQKGDCWLKSNFDNPTVSTNRYAIKK